MVSMQVLLSSAYMKIIISCWIMCRDDGMTSRITQLFYLVVRSVTGAVSGYQNTIVAE